MNDDDDASDASDDGHGNLSSAAPNRTLLQFLSRNDRTEAWLAKKVGVTQPFISGLVRRKRKTQGETALKLHKITGVPLRVLMTLPKRKKKKRPSAG